MTIDKKTLCKLLKESTKITLVISRDSIVEENASDVYTAELNDFILKPNGVLELWYNIGYEI